MSCRLWGFVVVLVVVFVDFISSFVFCRLLFIFDIFVFT